MGNLKEKALKYTKTLGIIRSKDLKNIGAPTYYLNLLEKEGKIQKLGRGLYATNDYEFDEKQSYMEICKHAPNAILCLFSALRFHEMTTQNPSRIWIAIENKDRKPNIEYPPINVIRLSGKAMTEGINIIEHKGVKIKVYCPAKTVADCFKYRNKIGIDAAIEALRDGWRKKLFTLKDLNYYSQICRVQNIIQPYIESLS